MCEGILIAVSAMGVWTGAALIGSGRVVSSGTVICCGTVVCLEGDIILVYVTDCVLPGALTIVEAAVNVAIGLARCSSIDVAETAEGEAIRLTFC
jgi:hypothetical protein